MSAINDGGPAFPRPFSKHRTGDDHNWQEEHWPEQPGMSLRDWFAGHALAGHLANSKTTDHPSFDREGLAAECWFIADAMLAARSKGGTS